MNYRKFSVDLLLGLFQPTTRAPLHLSPDGRKLIVNVQHGRRTHDPGGDLSYTTTGIPREMMGSCVLVVDTVTDTVEEPFPTGATSWGAQWSPDGTRLAAYVQWDGQACLGVWERTSGRCRLYAHIPVRPFFGFEVPRWTPDSQSVVVKLVATPAQKKRETTESAQADHTKPVTVFSFTPGSKPEESALPGWVDGYRCDLARVDCATGAIQRLVEDWRLIGWKVAPDGHAVAVMRYTEAASSLDQFYFDLLVLPLHHGSPRLLAHRVAQDYGICFNWSPDSQYIAYIIQEHGTNKGLYVVATDGSTSPQLLSDPGEELTLTEGDVEAPRWSEDGHFRLKRFS
jgi:hypothetical protein